MHYMSLSLANGFVLKQINQFVGFCVRGLGSCSSLFCANLSSLCLKDLFSFDCYEISKKN